MSHKSKFHDATTSSTTTTTSSTTNTTIHDSGGEKLNVHARQSASSSSDSSVKHKHKRYSKSSTDTLASLPQSSKPIGSKQSYDQTVNFLSIITLPNTIIIYQ